MFVVMCVIPCVMDLLVITYETEVIVEELVRQKFERQSPIKFFYRTGIPIRIIGVCMCINWDDPLGTRYKTTS